MTECPSIIPANSDKSEQRTVAVRLQKVRLDIPVATTQTRSLKASLIRSVTGGRLSRRGGGAMVTALEDVNCSVYEGERVALIGHNGAGKSTFLRLISGIYQHSSGIFEVNVKVHPMIHKSFVTSPELSGLQAIKAHYLMMHGNLRGFEQFREDVVRFSGPCENLQPGHGGTLNFCCSHWHQSRLFGNG